MLKKWAHTLCLIASYSFSFELFLSFALTLTLLTTVFHQNVYAAQNVEGIQVYQKNLPLSAEHKQNIADALTRYRRADNIWDVLRDEFSMSHYENNPLVQDKIEWYMNNPDFLLRAATRAAPYLYYILQQVKKRHLPAEIVLLPIIESGYNPFAISNMGASGIWQMMPETATGFGIKQDPWYDGRRDIIASTRGALNYLLYLQSFFEGNWLLAIAAYNTGEGNVLAAIKRNIREGRHTDFWSLPVAQQTRDYVPSLLALAAIISQPDVYPLYFPPVKNAPYLAQVDIGRHINLKYAASLAGISYKKLIQLNPGFNHTITSSRVPYKLVLPIENVEQFSENLARSPLNMPVQWIHYKIKAGDTLFSIAKKFNTTPLAIKKMNQLSLNNLQSGMNLLIPHSQMEDESVLSPTQIALSARKPNKLAIVKPSKNKNEGSIKKYILQPGDTIYMIRAHDTFESIAKRFKINPQILLSANQLVNKKLNVGKQIIIPTHSVKPSVNPDIQPGDTLYMVRNGDTLHTIAKKFHTSPSAIRLANLMNTNSIKVGEKLVVPTHLHG